MRLSACHCTGLVEGSSVYQVHEFCGLGLLLGVAVLLNCCMGE